MEHGTGGGTGLSAAGASGSDNTGAPSRSVPAPSHRVFTLMTWARAGRQALPVSSQAPPRSKLKEEDLI